MFEILRKKLLPPSRASLLQEQWAIARAEMTEHIMWVQTFAQALAKGDLSEHGRGLVELQRRRHANMWRSQIRYAMEAEEAMIAEGIPFDRGSDRWALPVEDASR